MTTANLNIVSRQAQEALDHEVNLTKQRAQPLSRMLPQRVAEQLRTATLQPAGILRTEEINRVTRRAKRDHPELFRTTA